MPTAYIPTDAAQGMKNSGSSMYNKYDTIGNGKLTWGNLSNAAKNTQISKTYGNKTASSNSGSEYAAMIASIYAQQLAAQQKARQAAYDATVTAQDNAYNNSLGKVNTAADKSLQEAYVNRMLSEKNINQQLSAQGLNGGATESTLAGIQNNYGNSRNNIEEGRNQNISDLSNTHQNNLAQAAAALESGMAGDYSDYASNLASLVASNPTAFVSTTQGDTSSNGSLAALQNLFQNYSSGTSNGLSTSSGSNMLSKYLSALGY